MESRANGVDRSDFDLTQIYQHWTDHAKQHGQSYAASWSDLPAIQLETEELLRFIEDGDKVLDIGCANGHATLRLAAEKRVEIRGLDYVPEMIQQAELHLAQVRDQISSRVTFDVGDITKLNEPSDHYDKVVVVRVIINLGDWKSQSLALNQAARTVKPGGLLLVSEATIQGWSKLNSFRNEWGLPALPMPEFNLYLDEDKTCEAFQDELDLLEIRNFASTYYVGTRVFKPLLAGLLEKDARVADPLMHWNRWFATLPTAGDYGTQKLFVFRKRQKQA